jgi:hypothetical protein
LLHCSITQGGWPELAACNNPESVGMDGAGNVLEEAQTAWFFAWLHVTCAPLLLLGPLHPGMPGHPLNPLPSI